MHAGSWHHLMKTTGLDASFCIRFCAGLAEKVKAGSTCAGAGAGLVDAKVGIAMFTLRPGQGKAPCIGGQHSVVSTTITVIAVVWLMMFLSM